MYARETSGAIHIQERVSDAFGLHLTYSVRVICKDGVTLAGSAENCRATRKHVATWEGILRGATGVVGG